MLSLFLSYPLEALFSLEGAMNGSFYELRAYLFRPSTRTSAGLFSFFSPSFRLAIRPQRYAFKRKRISRLFSSPSFSLLREGRHFALADFHSTSIVEIAIFRRVIFLTARLICAIFYCKRVLQINQKN